MERIADGFWDYVEKWEKEFPAPRSIWWNKNWIENDYCADCRFCCGPQDSDTPFPMPLLPRQLNGREQENFYLLDASTPYLARKGCKADTPHGCRLKLEEKPVACGLFPIVLVNGSLWLYQNCPAVLFSPLVEFLRLGRTAAEWLQQFSWAELRHLSLWLTDTILARNYIDLRIQIFDEKRKKLILR